MARSVFGIVGSYRKNGVIDTVVSNILDAAADAGARTEKIYLEDCDIRFCTNCRQCVQPPGEDYQPCLVHDDDMREIASKILAADTIVIGAPVNIGAANAITQRFIERCIGFYHYPWGKHFPVTRKKSRDRDAILVSSSAAPAFMNSRLFGSGAMTSLQEFAKIIGARVAKVIKVGLVNTQDFEVPAGIVDKARRAGEHAAA